MAFPLLLMNFLKVILFDTELVEMADKNQRYEMEDVFIGSQYLSMEHGTSLFR